jgi:hypothetical protein
MLLVSVKRLTLLLKAATVMPVSPSKGWASIFICVNERTIGQTLSISQAWLRSSSGYRVSVDTCIRASRNILTGEAWRLDRAGIHREWSLANVWCLEGTIQILKAASSSYYHIVSSKKHLIHVGDWFVHRGITSFVVTNIKPTLRLNFRICHALVL